MSDEPSLDGLPFELFCTRCDKTDGYCRTCDCVFEGANRNTQYAILDHIVQRGSISSVYVYHKAGYIMVPSGKADDLTREQKNRLIAATILN